ncbi:MAG: hypothetical protein V5A44_05305 [Haloarculaceae archaeon]
MVAIEAVIAGFVIAFLVVTMGVMVYLALGTEDVERSERDDSAAEATE